MLDGPESSREPDGDRRYRVQSVERALDTLDALAAAGPDGATLAELARSLGTSKSTVLALLAHLEDDHVATLVARTGLPARTQTTITDCDTLLRELAEIRTRGYAVDDEEDSVGVFCVGAAVHDHRNVCVAGVSLTGLKQTLAPDGIDRLGAAVRHCASSISRSLGASL